MEAAPEQRSITHRLARLPHNGPELMRQANQLLQQEAPDVPAVQNPGQALLVLGLHASGSRGGDLDYRVWEARWIELESGLASFIPDDVLPFTIFATESGAIEIRPSEPLNLVELLPQIYSLARSPRMLAGDKPDKVSAMLHARLSEIAMELDRLGGPWSRSMLIDQHKQKGHGELSPSQASSWLQTMVRRGQIISIRHDRSTTYRVTPLP